MEGGIGYDAALIFCQNGQDLIIVESARPLFYHLAIGHIVPKKAPVFSAQTDKKFVESILVIPSHGSQSQVGAIGKSDPLWTDDSQNPRLICGFDLIRTHGGR